jgi:hypothetical protein
MLPLPELVALTDDMAFAPERVAPPTDETLRLVADIGNVPLMDPAEVSDMLAPVKLAGKVSAIPLPMVRLAVPVFIGLAGSVKVPLVAPLVVSTTALLVPLVNEVTAMELFAAFTSVIAPPVALTLPKLLPAPLRVISPAPAFKVAE